MPLTQYRVWYTDKRGNRCSRIVIACSEWQAKKLVRGRNKIAEKLNV